MSDTMLRRTTETFTTRLQTLVRLLDRAEAQWREKARDPEPLLDARLAPDMLPLRNQIVFTCNQPNDFAAWCTGGARSTVDPAQFGLAQFKQHIADTISRLAEATGRVDDGVLARDKRIQLPGGAFLVLPGRDYVEDWLMPNFYFHMVTAYDILRHEGVQIGKPDYMAHLAGHVRQAGQG